MKLTLTGKEILIKKVFHLTHKENIEENKGSTKKTGEAITPIIDTLKLYDSKYPIERSQGQCKKWCRIGRK